MRALIAALAAAVAAVLAAGCASEVKRSPVDLVTAAPEGGQRFVTTSVAQARLDSGYTRTLGADTELVVVGRVAQGLVLRPTRTVLTVEGAHVHEAYVVHRDGQWVGFFLPVERAYSALPLPVPMPLKEMK
jgi:hypothetical protein